MSRQHPRYSCPIRRVATCATSTSFAGHARVATDAGGLMSYRINWPLEENSDQSGCHPGLSAIPTRKN
jgi:hypothetical protein